VTDTTAVRGTIRRLLVSALTVLLALAVAPAVPAAGAEPIEGHPDDAPDELTAEQDNAADGHDTCGGEPVAESGSRVIRRLVDGPRQPGTDRLAFTSGICIYLPPDYLEGSRRYPVLYLLHGAWGWQDDWFVQGGAQAILDRVRAGDPSKDLIVVTPDGGYMAEWRDEPSGLLQIETYVVDHVLPYVDRYFRTIDDRRGRALAGLSNGGAGTLRMAAHHPDLFGVVTAMSAALPVNLAANRTDVHTVHNDPTEVAENLNEVEMALAWGVTCGTPQECQANGAGWAFEHACCSNEVYVAKLGLVRDRPVKVERTDGAHTWYFWKRWLEHTHGEYIRTHLLDPVATDAELPPLAPPTSFSFRSIDPVVRIYDHTFTTDARRAAEFLTLTDVSASGLTVRGSGRLGVVTAAVHTPGRTYVVSGTGLGAQVVTADDEGRLGFDVDLGTPHTAAEGSPAAVAAEVQAAGSYWTTRAVGITPAP
jgi:S-formylglutathione hydrolase FrmB